MILGAQRLHLRKGFRQRIDFFKRMGAGSAWALKLARADAEIAGTDKVKWEPDIDCDLSWADDKQRKSIKECLCASIEGKGGSGGASLCGIVDPDRKYARQVAAELAYEAGYGRSTRRRRHRR